jgi:hypothetical protein
MAAVAQVTAMAVLDHEIKEGLAAMPHDYNMLRAAC